MSLLVQCARATNWRCRPQGSDRCPTVCPVGQVAGSVLTVARGEESVEEVGDRIWGLMIAETFASAAKEEMDLRRRKKKKTKSASERKQHYAGRLPKGLDDLIEANTHFMKNEFKEALEDEEIVRQCPDPDTYHTMGLIYEQQGDVTKAMNAFYSAAVLTDKTQRWVRCGRLCFSQTTLRLQRLLQEGVQFRQF